MEWFVMVIMILIAIVTVAICFYLIKKVKGSASSDEYLSIKERVDSLERELKEKDDCITRMNERIATLTSERDVLKSTVEMQRISNEKEIESLKSSHESRIADLRENHEREISDIKELNERQIARLKENNDTQIEAIKEMNRSQVENQLNMIREKMQTTSEEILKRRQEELGERNKEQVSQIIDPLLKSLKDMREAFTTNHEQQKEALNRLDETIKINNERSNSLGETADRLARALTGEVKVQGNFGELKLKQLLESLELHEGEQYETQQSLRDRFGKIAMSDEGKGLIPDFILHFPNNRHVVVDSKMSLTDFERYMNEENVELKSGYLKAHIASVRAQVNRLSAKAYTKYLPEGYNRLDFAFMYVPVESALNLALLNDTALWKEAYDRGVIILGPQTMYMNLRVLEMMWTQVRQLKNQQSMIENANNIIDRVQDFASRFKEVDESMHDVIKKIDKFKITIAPSGRSIITAAGNLIKAGAKENQNKTSIDKIDDSLFIESSGS